MRCPLALSDCGLSIPTTCIAGCCARAASGHAVAPPSSVMKSRRFNWLSPGYRLSELRSILEGSDQVRTCAVQDCFRPFVRCGSRAERLAASIFRPDYSQEQTSSMRSGTSDLCQEATYALHLPKVRLTLYAYVERARAAEGP